MNKILEKALIRRFVPMQTCPLCLGHGKIKNEFFNEIICPVCNGKRIIPMQIIEEEKSKDNGEKTLL